MSFNYLETTIQDLHTAIRDGAVTVSDLVQQYIRRIRSLDQQGPRLGAIVTINSFAEHEAARLDEYWRRTGTFVGPLHGVPILVKDQIETEGLKTTFGSAAFSSYVPTADATVIRRLKQAGAVILAKTTLCDFAAGWFSFSSVSGFTRNPYHLDREPGGSSAGTCVGVTANFGLVGIGEDTGGSVRLPASFTNLFGLRVTTGLISRHGMSPLVHLQDTPGPIARTVEDLAYVLDAMVGYDPNDPFTVAALTFPPSDSYVRQVDATPPRGWRVGVLRSAFGTAEPGNELVNAMVEAAIARLKAAGVSVVDPVTVEDLPQWVESTTLYGWQSLADLNAFLASRPGAVRTVHDLVAQHLVHPLNDLFEVIARAPEDPSNTLEYFRRRARQEEFRRHLLQAMGQAGVSALVFPVVRIPPPLRSELEEGRWKATTFPTNTVIASQAGLPAISVPAGFTADGLPVGMELLGMPYGEATLLRLARLYERTASPRRPPDLSLDTAAPSPQ